MTYSAYPLIMNTDSLLNGVSEYIVYADSDDDNLHIELDIQAHSESDAIALAQLLVGELDS